MAPRLNSYISLVYGLVSRKIEGIKHMRTYQREIVNARARSFRMVTEVHNELQLCREQLNGNTTLLRSCAP